MSGDSKINVVITATDKATKVVNGVNKSISKAFRPYEDAKKSVKSFADALGRNALVAKPLWALEKIGKGVTTFGTAFGVAENSIVGGSARVAAALGTIGGPVGILAAGAAAVVGGTTAIAVSMANMGFNVARTAKNLNIGTTELQEYRGAAKLAGLETQSMDNSLLSLGSTLQEAQAGRNPLVAESLVRMGVNIHKTKDGAVDTLQALRDVSDVVSHMQDQNMARKLTDMLGVTELLPLLREGTGKLDEYRAKVHQVGGVMDQEVIQRNKEQAESWNQTKVAIDGAGVSVGNLIAKYLNLDNAAAITGRLAEAASKLGGPGGSLWNKIPLPPMMNPKGFFSLFDAASTGMGFWDRMRGGRAPEGPRSSSGKIGDESSQSAAGPNSPRGIRNNNPGNLRSWMGAGSAGGYATFSSPEAGITAMAKNLLAYQDRHGISTIGGIANRWAPAGDGNNPAAYAASLAKQTGFGSDQHLDLHDPHVLAPLISAITKNENGQNPYSPEMITQAVSVAMKGSGDSERPINLVVHNVPAGMTIKPVRGLGQSTVGLAMAPGGMS